MAYHDISKKYILVILITVGVIAGVFGTTQGLFALSINDGDLIKTYGSNDVYIVKEVRGKQYKRLILNPEIFNSYGHLSWNNIKVVPESTLYQYTTSNLIRQQGDARVYELNAGYNTDIGVKHWLNLTPAQILALGFDPDSIYTINHIEGSDYFYRTGNTRTYLDYPQLTRKITDSSWQYVISDGGRIQSGYASNGVGDCVPRGIAIATGQSYRSVYQELYRRTELYKQTPYGIGYEKVCCENGTNRMVYKAYLAELGWTYFHEEDKPENTRLSLYNPELHQGVVMVIIDNHFFTIINGVAYDEFNIVSPHYKQNLNPNLYITGYFRKV